jgi:medium-chain acyl-[acyl-carrier-protein] hydrolase
LICLPYAGAGASVYREWSDQLADVCEAIAVQLPGREERMAEGAITDMARLASLLADALKSLPRARFAIFGHSMGALLAFELTRELRARGADMPAALLVSACPAPGSATGGERIRNLPDNEFRRRAIEAFDVPASAAADSEVWKSLLPVLRTDVTLMENYTPAEEPALNVPITAFGARADSAVLRQHLLAWSGVTSADYSLRMFDGGHMFVHDRAFPLALREELRKLETSPTLAATGR